MTDTERAFLQLANLVEAQKENLRNTIEQLDNVMKTLGTEKFVQDPETTIVYQIVKPSGTFMYYKDIDYIRTKKEGEKTGSLSMKKAEEAGFTLSK